MKRTIAVLGVVMPTLAAAGWGQVSGAQEKEPVADGRPLSAWIADLQAPAPQTRSAAAYEISGMGPDAAPAVPALIKALKDPVPAVRYAVTIALREIGPAAKEAVAALKDIVENDLNDEVAHGARRALRAIDPRALEPSGSDSPPP